VQDLIISQIHLVW